jgi:hypothetical protein
LLEGSAKADSWRFQTDGNSSALTSDDDANDSDQEVTFISPSKPIDTENDSMSIERPDLYYWMKVGQ